MAASFITSTIVFTPGNANVGTLQFSGISGFNVKRLKFAINLTRGVILFAPTVADYYAVSGDTLTLSVNTSTHNAADVIQAVYDDGLGDGTDSTGISQLTGGTGVRGWLSGIFSKLTAGATSIAKAEDVASADGDVGIPAMAKRAATPTNTSGTDGDYEMLQMNNGALWTSPLGYFVTCSTDITRPADTTAYAANDALSDSTSAPTSGGFTFTSAARKSGGSGIITDAWIGSTSPTGSMQGEIWIFDQAVTNVNDNAAFAITDAENKTVVGMIPFTTVSGTNNAGVHVPNLGIGFTCVGTANLRFLVKVKATYTPQSAEVLTVRIKCMQID